MSFKKDKKNKEDNNEISHKVQKALDKAINYQQIRKEKKIWFWLILFFPIGLYKSFKYKAFSKPVNISIFILILLTIILSIDNFLYPNRVIDLKMEKAIKNYESIGELRSYVKQGHLDDTFFIYNVVTTTGEYDIYFSGDGKLTIEGINQLYPKKEMIYKSDKIDDKFNNIYAEIIRFFNEEETVNKYGNIVSYENSNLENHQVIITDKGKYSIEVKYGQVISMFKVKDDDSLEKIMQRNPEIILPYDISKALDRNKKTIGNVKNIYGYIITDETIEYLFINDKNTHYKIVKYLDGSMEILIGNFTLFEEQNLDELNDLDEEGNISIDTDNK